MSGFEIILPFVRPIEALLADSDISEIMVNGSGQVFVERAGLIEAVPDVLLTEARRQTAVRHIARVLNADDINERSPMLDARLPDGSRVAAVLYPTSVSGTIISFRKFGARAFLPEDLVRIGSLSAPVLEQLREAIQARQTILISGGTGTGKTTLLNALGSFLPSRERIILIEDTAEISINSPNLISLEARRAQPDLPAVTIRDLLRQTLRLRPDRIILGEVRGAEAFDLLQALNTGHSGSLTTIHANTARLALSRLRTCVAMAGVEIPDKAVARNIAEVVQLVVHIERVAGVRRVSEILRVDGYESAADAYSLTSMMSPSAKTESGPSRVFL